MRVVIAASGTGGHVVPAVAVAEALRERGAQVSMIVSRGRAGEGLAAQAGFPEDTIPMRGLARRFSLANLGAVGGAMMAIPRALNVLGRRRPQVVVTAGGYLAAPVAAAARLHGVPVVALEADSHMGLANRMAAPLAKRMALAYPLPGRTRGKYAVTGRPVREAVRKATRTQGRRVFGIDPGATVVLVFGGSQGARTLNQAAVEAFGDDPPFDVIHVAGPGQLEETAKALAQRNPGSRYRLVGFLDNIHDAIAAADLVVSRSGGSVFELSAIGRASILVPYPHATADHQTQNARWLVDAGAAVLLPDAECTGPRLQALVGALLADRRRLEAMADSARAAGRPEAAGDIADMILEVAR